MLGIRPEAITDPESADRNSDAIHVLDLPVVVTVPAGSDTFVVSELGGRDVTGRFRADEAVKVGERSHFAFNMAKAVAFDPKTEKRIG